MDISARARLAVILAFPLLLVNPAHAQLTSDDVRFAVMGSRELDGSIVGETVAVHVPWDGVNVNAPTVDCLVGPFALRSDGREEQAHIGQDDAVTLRLRLDTSEEGTWEVLQANGRCRSLGGTGVFRRTSWPDGTVSYRFIGAARLNGGAEPS